MVQIADINYKYKEIFERKEKVLVIDKATADKQKRFKYFDGECFAVILNPEVGLESPLLKEIFRVLRNDGILIVLRKAGLMTSFLAGIVLRKNKFKVTSTSTYYTKFEGRFTVKEAKKNDVEIIKDLNELKEKLKSLQESSKPNPVYLCKE